MEEVLCNVELIKDNNDYIVKIQSGLGGLREYRSVDFEDILDQLVRELQEEFEYM